MLYDVAVKSPLRQLFTYESDENLLPGSRVRVPFGRREISGFIWSKGLEAPDGLKSISKSFEEPPLFDEVSLRFYERASTYYGIPLGELLAFSVPPQVLKGKPLLEVEAPPFQPELAKLSDCQAVVVEAIREMTGFSQHLIQGETGSGKTEVYLSLAVEKIKAGGQVLLLVPEISLTPQLEARLAQRLGVSPFVFHSNRTDRERFQTFCEAHAGVPGLFMGARSALFLPFKNLQMIIVDEEHDSSYKQQERSPYQARDLSILRATLHQIPVVLGSATPSLESLQRVREGRAVHYRLPKFYETPPIQVETVDLKKVWKEEGRCFLTESLRSSIEATLNRKEQVLLFLNRRGSFTQRVCQECGAMDDCPHCQALLTLHKDRGRAVCHLCGYEEKFETACRVCGSEDLFVGGVGTKEVEDLVRMRFPEARIERIDRDRVQKKNVLEDVLLRFAKKEIDILVGTQMISKGIDIPDLSLIGVIFADQGWGVPDFRAMERSFQLLKQLEGRAGRRGQQAKIIFQTMQPKHPLFEWLTVDSGFDQFIEKEREVRQTLGFPPFKRFALFHLRSKNEEKLQSAANHFYSVITSCAGELGVELVGPLLAPISRIKDEYRMQVLAKAPPEGHLTAFVGAVLNEVDRANLGVRVRVDRDPHQFL